MESEWMQNILRGSDSQTNYCTVSISFTEGYLHWNLHIYLLGRICGRKVDFSEFRQINMIRSKYKNVSALSYWPSPREDNFLKARQTSCASVNFKFAYLAFILETLF